MEALFRLNCPAFRRARYPGAEGRTIQTGHDSKTGIPYHLISRITVSTWVQTARPPFVRNLTKILRKKRNYGEKTVVATPN